jgi:hypothetical protein
LAWARERGLVVPTTTDPAVTPLVMPGGDQVLLAGTAYLPVPEA